MTTEQTQPSLNILVIGANGGIGKKAVEIALQSGHKVTAMVRNPANLTLSHPNLEIVRADIMQPASFNQYVKDKDAIISAIGGKMDKPTTLYSEGNSNLLAVMKKLGVRRVFFISSQAIEISPEQPFYVRWAAKYIVQKLFKYGYADQRVMEDIIKKSNINWTIMRPPRLTNGEVTGQYRVAMNRFLKNCLSISRADVAHFMLNNISNETAYKVIVEIAY